MKNKKIIYFSAFLSALLLIIAILLISTFIKTGSFELKTNSVATSITLLLSIIVVAFAITIAIVQIEGYQQIAMIRSVEVDKFVSYDDLNDLQLDLNLYRDIINNLSESEWNKVCEKYYKLKQQAERAKEEREYPHEYELILQDKIDTILKNCD